MLYSDFSALKAIELNCIGAHAAAQHVSHFQAMFEQCSSDVGISNDEFSCLNVLLLTVIILNKKVDGCLSVGTTLSCASCGKTCLFSFFRDDVICHEQDWGKIIDFSCMSHFGVHLSSFPVYSPSFFHYDPWLVLFTKLGILLKELKGTAIDGIL